MCSTTEIVCPEGWAYLKCCGYDPKDPGAAYTLLASLSQKGDAYRTGMKMLSESVSPGFIPPSPTPGL